MKNTVISTLKRWIVFLGLTTQGSMHDYELLKEDLHWYQGKNDWFEQLEILIDLGYLGFDKDFEALKTNIPHKKPKRSKNNPEPYLTEQQKAENRAISQRRIFVEHAIGGLKHFNCLVHSYRNHKDHFDDLSIEICAGLHNLGVKFFSH